MGLLLEDKFVDSTMLLAVPITHFAVVAVIFIMMSHEKACSAQA